MKGETKESVITETLMPMVIVGDEDSEGEGDGDGNSESDLTLFDGTLFDPMSPTVESDPGLTQPNRSN